MESSLKRFFLKPKEFDLAKSIIETSKGDSIQLRNNKHTKALLRPIDKKLAPVLQCNDPKELMNRIPASHPHRGTLNSILINWMDWAQPSRTLKAATSFIENLTPKKALILYFALFSGEPLES